MHDSPHGELGLSQALNDYYIRAKQALKHLVSIGFSLQLVFEMCSSQEKLDTESCQSILQLVERLNEPIQDLCVLLDERHQQISPCYTLEVTVFYTSEQVQKLVRLVEQFCTCRRTSAKKEGLKRKILCTLEIIATTYDDLLCGIPKLLDQPCFEDIHSTSVRSMSRKKGVIIPLGKRAGK